MEFLNATFETKAKEDGSFSGYASIFGNVDEGYDVVQKGAFTDVVKNADGKVVVLWHHNMRQPIGVADVKQDDKGLAFDGQLVLADPQAQVARAHMKAGSVRGMSIGFDVLPGGAEYTSGGVRLLKALKLWEISVVTFGMNMEAGVDSVKRAGQIATIRDFENFLREEGGFSHAQAKLLATGGFKALQAARDEPDGGEAVKQLTERLLGAFQIPTFK